jgi:hypothetical protein
MESYRDQNIVFRAEMAFVRDEISSAHVDISVYIPLGSSLEQLVPYFWWQGERLGHRASSSLLRGGDELEPPNGVGERLVETIRLFDLGRPGLRSYAREQILNKMNDYGFFAMKMAHRMAGDERASYISDSTTSRFTSSNLGVIDGLQRLEFAWYFDYLPRRFFVDMIGGRVQTSESFLLLRQMLLRVLDQMLDTTAGYRLLVEPTFDNMARRDELRALEITHPSPDNPSSPVALVVKSQLKTYDVVPPRLVVMEYGHEITFKFQMDHGMDLDRQRPDLMSSAQFSLVFKVPEGSWLEQLVAYFWWEGQLDGTEIRSDFGSQQISPAPDHSRIRLQRAMDAARVGSMTTASRLEILSAMHDDCHKNMKVLPDLLEKYTYFSTSTRDRFFVKYSSATASTPAELIFRYVLDDPAYRFHYDMVTANGMTDDFFHLKHKFLQTFDMVCQRATGLRLTARDDTPLQPFTIMVPRNQYMPMTDTNVYRVDVDYRVAAHEAPQVGLGAWIRPPVVVLFEVERTPSESRRGEAFSILFMLDVDEGSVLAPFAEYFTRGGRMVTSEPASIVQASRMHGYPEVIGLAITEEMAALRQTTYAPGMPQGLRRKDSWKYLAQAMRDFGARKLAAACSTRMLDSETQIQFSSRVVSSSATRFPLERRGNKLILHWEISHAPPELFVQTVASANLPFSAGFEHNAFLRLKISAMVMLDYLLGNINLRLSVSPKTLQPNDERDTPLPGGVVREAGAPTEMMGLNLTYALSIVEDLTTTQYSGDSLRRIADSRVFAWGELE